MGRPLPVAVGIRQSSCGKRNDVLWYNHLPRGKNFLVGSKKHIPYVAISFFSPIIPFSHYRLKPLPCPCRTICIVRMWREARMHHSSSLLSYSTFSQP